VPEIAGLSVTIDGSGPPVVLLHAGVADHRTFDAVAAALAAHHTVVRPDLRGFGASAPPEAGFRHRDDVIAVLDRLGLDRAALAGNSLGGHVALEVATHRPDRVSHLALLAPPLGGWPWTAAMTGYADAEAALLDAGDLDGAVALNQDQWVRGPHRDWTPALRDLASRVAGAMRTALAHQRATEERELDDDGPSPADLLDRLTMPTLVAVGTHDVPDFRSIARHLADRIPYARFVPIDGAGHLLPAEHPAAVTAALTTLLAT